MKYRVGRWTVGLVGLEDAADALALRAAAFRNGASDRDAWDGGARHLIVRDADGVGACARIWAGDPAGGLTAHYYAMGRFSTAFPRALEVGRVCLHPGRLSPDLPRLVLAVLARLVLQERATALFGHVSFPFDGAGLAGLRGREAPEDWRPAARVSGTVPLDGPPGPIPPLLRGYLSLGATVSDFAIVDPDLRTRHVFAALPVEAIPKRRAALLTGMLDAA
jgi:hypothetical protein